MNFQILNSKNNPKRKELLQKELQTFTQLLHSLAWKSHTIVSGLKEIQQRKNIEEKMKQVKVNNNI